MTLHCTRRVLAVLVVMAQRTWDLAARSCAGGRCRTLHLQVVHQSLDRRVVESLRLLAGLGAADDFRWSNLT